MDPAERTGKQVWNGVGLEKAQWAESSRSKSPTLMPHGLGHTAASQEL